MIDPKVVRGHFPALDASLNPPLYFDNPAGTQVARETLNRISCYLLHCNANHGGAFRASRDSDATVAEARQAMADLLGAREGAEISFGQNMTSVTLHLARSIARELSEGDEVVVTRLDHDANVSPWLLAARDSGATVRWLDFDPAQCAWSAAELQRLLSRRTRLVAVALASNAFGTVNPVAQAVAAAHDAGAWCFVDAVHFAPHGPIDVGALGCDFLACSAYKFFGPHTGVLYGRREVMERLEPYKVRPAADRSPDRWETGTQGFESIAGVLGAVEYLEWVGRTFGGGCPDRRARLASAMAAINAYERTLSAELLAGLQSVDGLRLYGITDRGALGRRVPTFAFTLDGVPPRSVCAQLDAAGINAWDGNFYALEGSMRLGLEASGGMVRVGAVHYNTRAEVGCLVEALRQIAARTPR